MTKPVLIGITGGIGSGKTTLSKLLEKKGYRIYNCDLRAKEIQNSDENVILKLKTYFGNSIYQNNELNRKELARIVFNNSKMLDKLNSIVHPAVIKDINEWIYINKTEKILFIESAILFESKLNLFMNQVITVSASTEERIKRVMKRDNSTYEEVKKRISNQMSDEERIDRSDFLIFTDDNIELSEKIEKLLKKIKS